MSYLFLVYILVKVAQDKTRTRVWRVHSSHLPLSRPVLIMSQSFWRHVGKSVPSQRKQEWLECLALLSMILAREYECLHSYILRLVHISPKVSTSTRDENVNQALHNTCIWIWIIAVNHPKTSKFNKAFEFSRFPRITLTTYIICFSLYPIIQIFSSHPAFMLLRTMFGLLYYTVQELYTHRISNFWDMLAKHREIRNTHYTPFIFHSNFISAKK